jgi:hypothetical protein
MAQAKGASGQIMQNSRYKHAHHLSGILAALAAPFCGYFRIVRSFMKSGSAIEPDKKTAMSLSCYLVLRLRLITSGLLMEFR